MLGIHRLDFKLRVEEKKHLLWKLPSFSAVHME